MQKSDIKKIKILYDEFQRDLAILQKKQSDILSSYAEDVDKAKIKKITDNLQNNGKK